VFWRRRTKTADQALAVAEARSIEEGVRKTRESVFGHIASLFRQPVIDEATWEQLEELLIASDMGPNLALRLVDAAREMVEGEELRTPVEAETALRRQLVNSLGSEEHPLVEDLPRLTVVHMVGVNGSGKTTSAAKLANYLRQRGRRVLLVAADTFRAAAIDQLEIWGERIGVPVIAGQPNADPGAVVFDAIKAAESRHIDVVIIDTAGRLHTKFNLMEELRKIKRVASKADPDAQQVALLVLDATTGQNALQQAKRFLETVNADGIVLAKLDGTAKGGVAFAVYEELSVPIWYVGTGEKVTDLAPFDHLAFVNALFE
jgi:fused signal recognition particle receptor